MEFRDVVRRRRMVRSFTDEPVAPDVLKRILDTARRGPSAGYSQGVEFVVVTDPAKRAAIAAPGEEMFAKLGRPNFVAQAPVHVIVCTSPEIYKSRYREADKMRVVGDMDEDKLWEVPFWHTDAGAAMMLLLLAAVDEGIAAALIGDASRTWRGLLGVPEEYILVGSVLLGHEAPDARDYGDVSATTRPRRAFDDIVHMNGWTS
jgi:nitroreductase